MKMYKNVDYSSSARISLVYRIFWAGLFTALALFFLRDGGVLGWTFGLLFVLFGLLFLIFSADCRISGSRIEIGSCGVMFRSVEFDDVTSVRFYSGEDMPIFYKFIFGVYYRGPGTWFFAAGRSVVHIRWDEGKKGVMCSVDDVTKLKSHLDKLGLKT